MERNYGIWLDSDKAVIIEDGKGSLDRISSEVEHYNVRGGAKGGILDGTTDAKLLARKNKQLGIYFDNVIKCVSSANKLVIFGPAETKSALGKEINQRSAFKNKSLEIETADNNMTDNQLIEWVRNYYKR